MRKSQVHTMNSKKNMLCLVSRSVALVGEWAQVSTGWIWMCGCVYEDVFHLLDEQGVVLSFYFLWWSFFDQKNQGYNRVYYRWKFSEYGDEQFYMPRGLVPASR